MSRVGYTLVVVVLAGTAGILVRRNNPDRELAAALDALDYRTVEARLARRYDHKPHRRIHVAGVAAFPRVVWPVRGSDARGNDARRLSGAALLFSGRTDEALSIFIDLLRQQSDETDALRLIHASRDADLLTDFSAAALERADDRYLLLAYEAADRAWQLSPSAAAGWNRALAAHRIGMYPFAERAWREMHVHEVGDAWAREVDERRAESARRANAPPPAAYELFFQRDLFTRILAGETPSDVIAEDRLASDATSAMVALRTREGQQRLHAALREYLRARDAADRSEVAVAAGAYAAAAAALDTMRVVPLAWIARDQQIRCDCVLRKAGCLEAWYTFEREVAANGRYPWLAARAAFGEGQTLYRQGRVYEAAQSVERALVEHQRLGDGTGAAQMHSILTNIYAAGGESELALRHFLQAIVVRTPPDIVDRRRRILEDGIIFMLRHGYLATAELLLDELKTAATTDGARVYAATLRGVAAFRRGDRHRASQEFVEARIRLRALPDAATRADYGFRLAIAEAESRMQPASSILADLDAGVAVQSGPEHSIWLPPLLTERGATFERANDLDRAEADYLRAIDVLESREPRIDQTVLALGLTAPSESPFDRAIRVLLRRGRIVHALSVADRASALRISSLHARSAGVRDVFRLLREHGDSIAETRAALGANEIAVTQYLLQDELVAWLITKDAVRVVRHAVRHADVVRHVERLQHCRERTCVDVIDALSAALLHPWIDHVPRGATLLLQPAAELEAVPFAMLKTRDHEHLVLRNASATTPNLRALVNAAKKDGARAGDISAFFAAAADPGNGLEHLPRAIAEVTGASLRYRSAVVESRATRASFLARSPSASILHFAGHIVIDPARPLFSALVFDRGEFLYVHELDARSFANTRVIILSGCDSGRTPRPAMSVANALLSQSVPSVVYTFRAVDDEVAEAFGLEFHRVLSAGKSRAEAVREAQLFLLRTRSEDSTTWAAFALAGVAGPMSE